MKKNYFSRFCVMFAVTAAMLLTAITIGSRPALAADEKVPDYRIGLTPTFVELDELTPGKTYDGVFKVLNTGAKDFDVSFNITPYSVTDDTYGVDSVTETNYTQLSKWIKLSSETAKIPAGSSQEIKYSIHIPADAPAGGQYALINVRMVQNDNSDSGASISAAKQLGFRVLASVEGKTNISGKVTEQGINSILFSPPITATSVVENTGNTHIRATYTLQVFPLFGDEEVYTNEETPQEITVLPETSRYNSISWDGAPHLGIFRVRQIVSIANNTEKIEKIVFLCPIWLVFIVLLLIFCTIFWIFSRVRGRGEKY